MIRLLATLLFLPTILMAKGERTGDFDYYVLSLSWSPNWCALEGDAKDSPQCEDDKDYGWVLHGLWPQYEQSWPSYCPTNERNPSRQMTNEMIDVMGTSGLAWHQWNKHGTCAGVSATEYYDLSREAYNSVTRPPLFRKLPRAVSVPAKIIEEAFLQSNPQLSENGVTITCRAGMIQEVRICLNDDLSPRKCGQDVIRDCTMTDADLLPIK